ncbi:MAG: hypothetical protein N2Z21_05940 [Candidatus Sumerlaeaceae bacterium]|nr:hypothetical protein [Candidatus Sumerlaeaceae bacterium]
MAPKSKIAIGLVAVVALILGINLLRVQFAPVQTESGKSGAPQNGENGALERSAPAVALDTQAKSERRKFEIRREILNRVDPNTSAPVFAVDPENQPRAFMTMDFRNLETPPPGYRLENVVLSPEGFTLPPPEPGKENQPRMGVIESPPQMFDFFSNAVAPLWKENLPDGTDMFVEMSVSPDGIHWGPWQWVEIDEDSIGQISPTYPDGRPNPNYGYTPGTMLAWGLTQWGYVRYRVRLYSEGPASPVLSAFRLFYQDSTLGEGRVATPETMQVEEIATARNPQPSSGAAQ